MKGDLINQDAIAAYNKFLRSGIPLEKYNHPDIDKKVFTATVKFILTIVVPDKAIYLSH